ncbi:membrane protein [Luteimicrobium xylanilyticum]|uniref:Secreted protein n=1 Tax=Luteimicrobium xylanilyticum TaxID=1133546 RepID=A0A5P9QAY0_9MICO|nr:hypothetical protein [Luteimicrobium xylanilyticum]QFU98396.1 hypothetical protein KDY119_01908 [Luteimicrobium xylanilyticum]
MRWSDVAVLGALVLFVVLWLAWAGASHIDRLHRKVYASRLALDAQLVRRAAAARDLASSGLLDPASSVLVATAAYRVLGAGELPDLERERAESDLSATLRAVLEDPEDVRRWCEEPDGEVVLGELAGAWYRAQLARRFHNEAVDQTQRRRRRWYVRLLRLAGHAALPQTAELDDASPASLRPLETQTPASGEGALGVG